MRSQHYRLAEAAEHPKTTIQVVHSSGGAHAGLLGGFIIADLDGRPPMAYLETAAHAQVTDSPSVWPRNDGRNRRHTAEKELQRQQRRSLRRGRAAAPAVAVRDSKHPDGPQLTFAANTWKAFTGRLKATA